MPLVARRKLRQSWREAVAQQGGAQADEILARFDALCREGRDEGEAAYRVLEAAGRLSLVDEPGAARPSSAEAQDLPAL